MRFIIFQTHNGTCPQEPIYCENKCGARIQRRRMSRHRAAECPKRMIPCRHCHKEFVGDTLATHHSLCPRLPISCPQRCEKAPLPREELETHLKDECDRLQISCAFRDAGCNFKVSIKTRFMKNIAELQQKVNSILIFIGNTPVNGFSHIYQLFPTSTNDGCFIITPNTTNQLPTKCCSLFVIELFWYFSMEIIRLDFKNVAGKKSRRCRVAITSFLHQPIWV